MNQVPGILKITGSFITNFKTHLSEIIKDHEKNSIVAQLYIFVGCESEQKIKFITTPSMYDFVNH